MLGGCLAGGRAWSWLVSWWDEGGERLLLRLLLCLEWTAGWLWGAHGAPRSCLPAADASSRWRCLCEHRLAERLSVSRQVQDGLLLEMCELYLRSLSVQLG